MDRFIGREKELGRLEKIYSRNGLKTCMIYGRRQIGKSTLISKFCEGKRSLIIQSSDASEYENLTRMRLDISAFLDRDIRKCDTYTELMLILAEICRNERIVLVFDEFSYLIRTSPQFPSILQRFIDIDIRDTETTVIICGSSISIMCSEIESPGRPLYGRFTDRMEIGPLSYRECMKFHENMSDLDSVRTYLTVGGIPKYHRIMCESTYKEAIVNHFLSKDADLFGEGAHVITNELPSVSYTSIAACIADGYVTQYEIADKIRMDRAQCKLFIGRLENIGVVERQHMMFDSPKRPRYTIRDSIVAFYFEVMRSVSSEVMGSADDDLKYRMSEHRIDTFLGRRFEQLCGEYLDEHFCLKERGKWTGKDSELDIVAKAVGEDLSVSFIFAECKFTRNAMDMSQFNEFAKTVSRFRDTDNKRLMLFSANGFDRKLRGFAETNDVELIDLAGLLG